MASNDREPLVSTKATTSEADTSEVETAEGDREVGSDDDNGVIHPTGFETNHGGVATEPCRKNVLTVDEAIEKMGFGPFQILVTFFCGLLWLADAMELMILSVLSPAVGCQWKLSNSEGAAITSVVFVGFLLGGLVWGVLSDIIGRKMGLLAVNICILVFGVLSAIKVAPDDISGKRFGYPWLLICRFGVGFGAGGSAQSVTYYAEFLPQKLRGYCLVLIEVWWTIGSIFGALLALAVMNTLGWHWYLGFATIPLFLVLVLFPCVPESARYYLMKQKPDKVKDVLSRVAWFNRKRCPTGYIVTVEQKESMKTNQEFSVSYNREEGVSFEKPSIIKQEAAPLLEEHNASDEDPSLRYKVPCYQQLKQHAIALKDMFSDGMWKTTVLLWILWIGCGWTYYGAVLLTTSIFQYNNHCFSDTRNNTNETTECGQLSNNAYIKIVWTAAAELPGLLVTILIIEVFGRRKTMALEFTVTMIAFLLLFVCTTLYVTTFFLFLIRAFATGVFQAVFVYTPEVYSTNIRASALGLHTGAARIGALLTPFNAQVLFHTNNFAAVALYSTVCLVMAFASILLPIETKGKSMKDGRIH